MPLRKLNPKPGAPVVDSGHLLAHLRAQGVTVAGDTVIAYADGSVEVDTPATTALLNAWDAYAPPPPPEPPPTKRERLRAEADALTTIPAPLRAFLRDRLIPALVPDEP